MILHLPENTSTLTLHVLFCTSRRSFPHYCLKLESFSPVLVEELDIGTLAMVTFSPALVGVPGTGALATVSSPVLVLGSDALVMVIYPAWVVVHGRPGWSFRID